MLSPRRSRAFVLVPVLLFLITWYYCGFASILLQLDRNKFKLPHSSVNEGHAVVEPPVSLKSSESLYSQPTPSISSAEDLYSRPTLSTSIVEPSQTAGTISHYQDLVTSPSDVLLIFKTGASTFWRRIPVHLITTLSNGRVPNSVIYSDLPEKLASNIESVDALANVSDLIKSYDPAAHDSYLELQSPSHVNTYREHARLPGDEPKDAKEGNTPGWLLDKYKFLPMLTHAQRNWPGLRWYIYIEDDTFIFWNNILQWLSTLSPDNEPSYYGAYSGDGNETFAQGGSGLVFSRSLMRTVFGGDKLPGLLRYGNYTSNSCCGDIVLGKVLRDHGIYVNGGNYGPVSFRPEPPWKTGFDELIWCAPVFTFHHLHQRDLIELAEVERTQRASSMPSVSSYTSPKPSYTDQFHQRPVIFRDIFTALILPHLGNNTRSNWDNFASRYTLSANSTTGFHSDFRPANRTAFDMAFKSSVRCQTACISFDACLSWRHDSAASVCALDTVIKLGRELDPLPTWAPKTEVVSGWMLERMDSRLLSQTCDVVKQP